MADKIDMNDLLLAETVLKVSAIEKLLVRAGVFTSEELTAEIKNLGSELMKHIKKSLEVQDKENN